MYTNSELVVIFERFSFFIFLYSECQRGIKTVFVDIVLREPNQGELSHHTNRCIKGSSIDSIRATLFNSNERKQVCTREITNFYKVFLDRSPSKGELHNWVAFCAGGRLRLCHIMKGIAKQGDGRNLGVSGTGLASDCSFALNEKIN